jgi:hypothetical protein
MGGCAVVVEALQNDAVAAGVAAVVAGVGKWEAPVAVGTAAKRSATTL